MSVPRGNGDQPDGSWSVSAALAASEPTKTAGQSHSSYDTPIIAAVIAFGFAALFFGGTFRSPVAPVTPPVTPQVVVTPAEIRCQCGTAKTSRPFRVTCPTCHYDLTVVPPVMPTGDFGKVAKTGTGELPK
jgi:hypothetical protein